MPELRYSTPSGIAVTRVVSKVNFKKGLKRLLRDLDSHRGVYLSSGYEFPGRYVEFHAAADSRAASALGFLLPGRLRPARAPAAFAEAVLRGGAQQAALGVFHSSRADRGIPASRGFPAGPDRRVRVRPPVSIRAH